LKYDTCCVCYEETSTFTECNHALCKTCRDLLINSNCPICKKYQKYKKVSYKYWDDDDWVEGDEDDDEDYENETIETY